MGRDRKQRWHAGGWESFSEARDAFRVIITTAQAVGIKPGEALPEVHREALEWLLSGHPRVRELWRHKIRYFTFESGTGTRQGRYGFVLVDERGVKRAFSTTTCLTGVERMPVPATAEELAENPFKGLVS